jgi:hypothetical protein
MAILLLNLSTIFLFVDCLMVESDVSFFYGYLIVEFQFLV